tara:strand:+ start:1021 stop:1920 length:900 start_codon:yes stop_codon:yes gene_type:complete
MVNPVWLRTFVSLARTQHFTRTAEQLFMTQSGVSQHIKKLEQQLGVTLIARNSSAFELTEAGQRLLQTAEDLVETLDSLATWVADDPDDCGEVRVMSPGSVGLKLYDALLGLQLEHPGLVIDYRFAPNVDVETRVADKQVDIGLMTQAPQREGLQFHQLSQEQLLLITPATYPTVDFMTLRELGFIDHPDGYHHGNLLLSRNFVEFSHMSEFNKRGFSNQINLILEPVKRGLGFTVLPEFVVEQSQQRDALQVHPLSHPAYEPVYCVTRKAPQQPRRVARVKHFIETSIQRRVAGDWLA